MSMTSLLDGYQAFYRRYFEEDNSTYQKLSTIGQSPESLVISCSDSRVDPSILFNAEPGEIFAIRNVANIVPPYQPETKSLHGVSAAVEFAVCYLNVKNIIVLGHSQCAGIRALYEGLDDNNDFISEWVNSSDQARETVKAKYGNDSLDHQLHMCEKESVKLSVKHLHEFPWIQQRIENGTLNVLGAYFDVKTGQLEQFEEAKEDFKPLIKVS